MAAIAFLALARRSLVLVTVSGHSMAPTVPNGGRLLVRRQDGRGCRPGQLVVFRPPDAGSVGVEWFVKRVAAVAGDPVPSCILEAYKDTTWTVPDAHIAVLGDAQRSRDSRHFGLVPLTAVLGVACRPWRDKGTE